MAGKVNEENTKLMIQNMSLNLFAENGYEGIGVQEICNVCKVSKPTLYYYFGSKAGILKAIIDSIGSEFVMTLLKATEYKHDFQQSLYEIFLAVLTFAKKNSSYFRIHCIILNSPKCSESKDLYEETAGAVQKMFDDFFTNSCAEFGNMKGKEKLYSTLFQNNVNSLVLSIIQGQLDIDDGDIHQIIHSFIYGVAS